MACLGIVFPFWSSPQLVWGTHSTGKYNDDDDDYDNNDEDDDYDNNDEEDDKVVDYDDDGYDDYDIDDDNNDDDY